MHTTNLRKVGGSVMLAVPPALLDVLDLKAGSKVNLGIDRGRLIVAPRRRPSYTLEELIEQCEQSSDGDESDRAWLEAKPVGRELL
ncbi:MAG: antitoxin [Gammaproteobacteria bacterium]|nr:antitoxin [Gammaproteobacteria bacterium]